MIWPFARKPKVKGPVTRRRIFGWAFAICMISAALDAPMPLEDLLRGARNTLRARPADGKIIVIAIDEKTISRLGSSYYSRAYNAQLLDKLFAMGGRKVFFDEAFSQPLDQQGDDAFVEALKRHPGRVALGELSLTKRAATEGFVAAPLDKFRAVSQLRALHSSVSPLSLSVEQYYADNVSGQIIPSVSTDLGQAEPIPDKRYRPDWAIRVASIPTYSLVDILDSKIPAEAIRGKDILVGVTAKSEPDFVQVIGQSWFPGVYTHVVGSQTLREGRPMNIGWYPGMLFASLISAYVLWTRSRHKVMLATVAALLAGLAVPLVLDAWFIKADFISAYLMFAIVTYRARALRELSDARLTNATTLLPNLAALREEPLASSKPIIAMRIRNYAAVGASFSESVENELITEIARRLTLPGQKVSFYQAEDALYWLGPALNGPELEGHLAGLARLMESLFIIGGRKIDVLAAFGVDLDLARPVASRIGRALLAADTAAAKHQAFMVNTSDNDEESAWELSLMSELDEAIDNGDIWIAYQPQFELKSDRIIGAEALVRWLHPVRGAISPEAFILPAEEHNRIGRLTFHILELATRAARGVVFADPTFRLSVNISASLMEQDGLPERIVDVLQRTGFPTANLTLEVTESAPFSEHAMVGINLAGIAALGIELSIDDYGTGNATLDYLRTVPFQEIKIDRRFITNLGSSTGDMLLVESTIELAHSLGRRVIAEGIEDPETLELLRAIDCDIAQGFYLAKPMRIEALESLLSASARIRAA